MTCLPISDGLCRACVARSVAVRFPRLTPGSHPSHKKADRAHTAAMEQPDMNIVSNVSIRTTFFSCVPHAADPGKRWACTARIRPSRSSHPFPPRPRTSPRRPLPSPRRPRVPEPRRTRRQDGGPARSKDPGRTRERGKGERHHCRPDILATERARKTVVDCTRREIRRRNCIVLGRNNKR